MPAEELSVLPRSDLVIGIDIGGTFTDCALVRSSGQIVTGKAPTTPSDLAVGFFDAIADAAAKASMGLTDVLDRADRICHGTTTGLNALLTGNVADVALVTTAGHADAIRIMNDRGRILGASMAEMLDWSISSNPTPILPRDRVVEIHERVNSQGEVVTPLTDQELDRVTDDVLSLPVQSVAICCLWSFANRSHEIRIRDSLEASRDSLWVSCSSEVAPRLGVYPRAVSTVMNAQLMPLMANYVERITARAQALGFPGEVYFVTNDGGMVPAAHAARSPVATLKSGPVAGVVGTALVASQHRVGNVIVADMGGTTFDVSVIRNGRPGRHDDNTLLRQMVHLRSVDVESVGAGGGSIAWIDPRSQALRVGPRSAGARPGPICYGQGGTEVTVTDADLVLGILNPEKPLAGNLKLDRQAALDGLEQLGSQLGLDPVQCAAGVVEVVDSLMEDLVRSVTVQRGQDPRDYELWVYGGASGAHAGLFSRQLGVRRIVLPQGNTASVWSAVGCTLLNVRRDFSSSVYITPPWDLRRVATILSELERDASAYAAQLGLPAGSYRLNRSAALRYGLQVHQVEVPAQDGDITEEWADGLVALFERAYEDRFGAGTGFPGAGATLTSLRLALETHDRPETSPLWSRETATGQQSGHRQVYWNEIASWIETPVLAGNALKVGEIQSGPVIVEYPHTTLVARPGQSLWLDDQQNVVLDITTGG